MRGLFSEGNIKELYIEHFSEGKKSSERDGMKHTGGMASLEGENLCQYFLHQVTIMVHNSRLNKMT